MEPERNGPKRKAEASASPLQPLGVQGVINSGREAPAGGVQGGDKQRPVAKERAPRSKTPKQLVTACISNPNLNPNPNPSPNPNPNPNPSPNPNPNRGGRRRGEAALTLSLSLSLTLNPNP